MSDAPKYLKICQSAVSSIMAAVPTSPPQKPPVLQAPPEDPPELAATSPLLTWHVTIKDDRVSHQVWGGFVMCQ